MGKVQAKPVKHHPRHFIREWRKHRGLSQETLAEHLGVTHGAISQLERGITGYTQPMLENMADVLKCSPSDLIVRKPSDVEVNQSILEGLSPELQKEAIHFIEYLRSVKNNAK